MATTVPDIATAKRREMRKRKILLNSESRLSKLSSHNNDEGVTDNIFSERIPCPERTNHCTDNLKNKDTEGSNWKNETKGEHDDRSNFVATAVETKDHSSTPEIYPFNISRAIAIITSALLFFHQGKIWSWLTKFTNFFPEHEIGNQSFLIWFCLTEIIILFLNLESEVLSGSESNILMLGLRLCGVSEVFLRMVQQIKLRCSEMMTNLTLFLFMIVIIQNISELL